MFSGIDRIEELNIRSFDNASCATMTSWVSKIGSSVLRRLSLSLTAPRDRLVEALSPQPVDGQPTVWRKYTWLSLSYLGRSKRLTMRSPTGWLEVVRVLSAAPNLSRLHLFRVECFHTSSYETIAVLERLETLWLTIAHPSGAELLAFLEMPALRWLRFVHAARAGAV
ncbi:hypothetical protein B0H16DRAFT_1481012 [Mycena metata]|uniref:F-box domain-containing protein n=1 Tax=Mycena metata TaxID=1033252 RepID=A0AAD7H058_9AGAR|nr:hypothetical protein B0H16DRAFT_1481012 [Mycena metata]